MSGAGARKFRAPGRRETEFCILVSNSCVASVCVVRHCTYLPGAWNL